ncbi:hypothetical protein GW915_09120 [bacterium]|nr:hypothetical protein [bacterium]
MIWILLLSLLSVALKNSEQGLSGDAPLYASISENMIESGDYFSLDAAVPDFKPNYNEHPHLSFWLQALIFKVFGAHDWSARILGHIYYICFLLLFFFSLRALVSEAAAVIGVFILWIQPHFSATFSSFLLDPGALFWGCLFLALLSNSLRKNSNTYSILAGLSLGLCALTKGLTFLGFGLPAVFILVLHLTSPQKVTRATTKKELFWQSSKHSILALGSFALIFFLYSFALSKSSSPDFLEYYWLRQVSNRFSNLWTIKSVFLKEFWFPMLKDSLGFLLLIPFAFLTKRSKLKSIGIPLILFLSFVLSYAPAHRFGGQYLIMFLPSIAWLSAIALERIFKRYDLLISFSQSASLLAFIVLQYTGIPIHGSAPSTPLKVLAESIQQEAKNENSVYLDSSPEHEHFISASRLVWYSKARVVYASDTPEAPSKHRRHYLYSPSNSTLELDRIAQIKNSGWCTYYQDQSTAIFKACSDLRF